MVLFFFQAEDGIRDLIVTGVQTCALPIDEVMGEAPAAFVVAGGPADVTVAARLGEFASENLPIALRPKLIEVVPELPKSPPARCSGSSCTNGCGRGRTRPDACNQSRATRLENRSAASSRLSSEVANERRRYPDPPGPNPAPSSNATASSWRSRSASAAALRGRARTSGKAENAPAGSCRR